MAAVGLGQRGQHLGVHAGVVVGREAAAVGVVQGAHGILTRCRAVACDVVAGGSRVGEPCPERALPAGLQLDASAVEGGRVPVEQAGEPLGDPCRAGRRATRPDPLHHTDDCSRSGGRVVGRRTSPRAHRATSRRPPWRWRMPALPAVGACRGGCAHDRHPAAPRGERGRRAGPAVVWRSVSTRLPESQSPVVVGRVREALAAAPATHEVEERVDAPVLGHDLPAPGPHRVAVEQVADTRVDVVSRVRASGRLGATRRVRRRPGRRRRRARPRASRAAQGARPVAPVAPVTTTTRGVTPSRAGILAVTRRPR